LCAAADIGCCFHRRRAGSALGVRTNRRTGAHAKKCQLSLTIDKNICENDLARTGSNFGTAALISGVTM